MSGYLQRLFDRASAPSVGGAQGSAPGLRQPLPSGPSLSPIAEADQRLNDPDLASQLGFGLSPPADLGEDWSIDEPLPLTPRLTSRSPAAPPLGRRAAPQPPAATSAVAPRSVTAPELGFPVFAPPQVGRVVDADLIVPEPQPEISEPTPPARPRSAAAEPGPRSAESMASRPTTGPDPAAPGPVTEVARPPAPADRRGDAETQPIAAPSPGPAVEVPVVPPAFDPFAAARQPFLAEPEPRSVVEALPPPIVPPPPPEPPVPAPATVATAAPPPREPAPAAPQERPPVAEEPRRNRPMTAAEASIIGTLAPRGHAVTLFGLRRR